MKKAVKRLIYGRTAIVVLCLLVQAGILALSFIYLSRYITVVFGSFTVLSALVTIHIMNTSDNPYYKLAWIIPVLVVPVFGTLFYLWAILQPGPRAIHKRYEAATRKMLPSLQQNPAVLEEIAAQSAGEACFVQYMNRYANAAVYNNTHVAYLPLGEDKMAAMLVALENAHTFIFLEYFIVEYGEFWGKVLEVLKRKAAEGVEVRFMYDGTCEFALLPHFYPKELAKHGIKAKAFCPLSPVFSTHQNNRDHRKICVVDNKTGFTGGVNLGDEYINKTAPHGHWKDTAVQLDGKAVRGLTMLYLQMWNTSEKQLPDENEHKKYLSPYSVPGSGYVLPYGDSPLDGESVGLQVYIDILNRAQKYVHIMTPYLIIDNQMEAALKYAAKRGVTVKIIMPHIPDKAPILWLGRTFYAELLASGVEIYEYTPGFVHAKVFVSDGVRATVGTINLDYRSLYLHFECGAYLYQNSAIADIAADYAETLAKCQKITPDFCRRLPWYQKTTGRFLRLFAPLM